MKKLLPIICCAMWILACEDGDTPPENVSYQFQVGDTLITIPAEAVRFAGTRLQASHFNWHAYMLREYQVATMPRQVGSPYSGTLVDWKNTSWSTRRSFLFAPFEHDVTTTSPELYYYMIGTYPEQFGFGWVDTFDPEADLWNSALRPWLNPADSTLAPDLPGTLEFDGGLGDMLEYRGMWERE